MKKQSAAIAAVLMAAVIGVFGFFAGKFLTEDLTDPNTQHIKLGLDLAGGVSITYKVAGDQTPTEEDFADTQQKLQMRAETYSTEAQVYREGTDRISIEIPGENDADKVLADLGSPGSLYFLSEKDSEGNDNYSYFMSQDGGVVMGITKTIEELEKDGCVLLSGSDVLDAKAGYQQDSLGNNQPVVRLDFTPEGTKKFADATTKAFQNGETIAIYYDGQIISAPSVKAAITTGSAIIEGMGNGFHEVCSCHLGGCALHRRLSRQVSRHGTKESGRQVVCGCHQCAEGTAQTEARPFFPRQGRNDAGLFRQGD